MIADARARSGDPLAGSIPTHVTLLPPTDIAGLNLLQFTGHLAQVARELRAFRAVLSGSDSFRPVSSVAFVKVAGGGGSFARLQQLIRRGPLERALDFPYHPHVTLAHDVPDDALDALLGEFATYHQTFVVPGFDLYEQDEEGRWFPVRTFTFG